MSKKMLNLSQVEDAEDFTPLPDGEYLCSLEDVEETTTKERGDDLWRLKWRVEQEVGHGRIIFDQLVFSAGGLKRVKLVLKRLGFNVDGPLELSPEDFKGIEAHLTVRGKTYTRNDGTTGHGNEVEFGGYRAADGTGAGPPASAPPGRPASTARPPARSAPTAAMRPPPRSAAAPAASSPPPARKLPF